MAIPLTINGFTFEYPETDDEDWGPDATDWAVAVTSGMLQKAGGLFVLLDDVDFGANYGLLAEYFSDRADAATSGLFRLANDSEVAWRNAADSANLGLKVNSSDILEFAGNPLITLALGAANTALRMNSGGTAYEWGLLVNANISNSAAIAYSKLALTNSIVNADINSAAAISLSKLAAVTASRALVSDGSGIITPSGVTATELAYLTGVTSAVQTQLDAKQARSTLTTKGDLYVATASGVTTRQPVGANGTVLTADSAQATGLNWTSPLVNPMTTEGDIIVGGTAGAVTRLGIGSQYQMPISTGTTLAYSLITNNNVDAAAAIAYSKLALTNSIVNADISGSAAIAYSKLALTNSIVNADISSSAAIAYSKLALSNSIVNADINTSAAIAGSKIVAASASVAGVMTTGTQTLAGQKTFSSPLFVTDQEALRGTVYASYPFFVRYNTQSVNTGSFGEIILTAQAAALILITNQNGALATTKLVHCGMAGGTSSSWMTVISTTNASGGACDFVPTIISSSGTRVRGTQSTGSTTKMTFQILTMQID